MRRIHLSRSVLVTRDGNHIVIKDRNISKKSTNRYYAETTLINGKSKNQLKRQGRNGNVTINTSSTGPRDPKTEYKLV